MGTAFLEDLVTGNIATLGAIVNNGECRFLGVGEGEAVDGQGFPDLERAARKEDFWPCSWSIKSDAEASASERIIGDQPLALFEYVITVHKIIDDDPVVARVDDLLEFRETPGGETLMLQITAVVNQSNVAWAIHAVNTNAP